MGVSYGTNGAGIEGVPPAKRGFTTLREFGYKNSRFSPR
ncbi:hypothetical protein ABIE66_005919 [Peribacillus sp. B2I2]